MEATSNSTNHFQATDCQQPLLIIMINAMFTPCTNQTNQTNNWLCPTCHMQDTSLTVPNLVSVLYKGIELVSPLGDGHSQLVMLYY
jgi:hypothetical protein